MKRKLLAIFLILSLLSIIIVTGCGTTQPPPAQTTQPAALCNTLYVVSNCQGCFGTIFVNGIGTGQYLMPWGATTVTVSNVQCGQVISVFLQHPLGWVSHSINVTATSPQTIVSFDWF